MSKSESVVKSVGRRAGLIVGVSPKHKPKGLAEQRKAAGSRLVPGLRSGFEKAGIVITEGGDEL